LPTSSEHLVIGEDDSLVPSPWNSALKVSEAADYCAQVYKEIVPELAQSLNAIHGISCPDRYWQILLGPWLLHFITILYDRYQRIENACLKHPGLYTHILPEEQRRLATFDTYDFISVRGQATQDYYNLKLFSSIMEFLHSDKIVYTELNIPDSTSGALPKNSLRNKIGASLLRFYEHFTAGPIILSDMYHLTYAQLFWLHAKLRFKTIKLKNFKNHTNRFDNKNAYSEALRKEFKFEKKTDKFLVLLYHLLPQSIPLCYLENFSLYRNRVKNVATTTVVGSSVGWYFNENFKYFAAEALLNKARLVDFQTGGGYGISLNIPAETLSFEKDFFYAWGLPAKESHEKIITLPSPYLSKLHNAHLPKNNNILMIGNGTHKYLCRFQSYMLPDDMPKYFNDKYIFLKSLNRSILDRLYYRPYQEIGWRELETIKKMQLGIKFLSKGKLTTEMKKAKLVIIDHQSTSYIEAFIINVPCVCFWDHDIYTVRPEVEKYFDKLRKAGILYKTPQKAAKKVNEIFDDPLHWWMSPEIQEAKNLFCNNFAVTSKKWSEEWKKELSKI